MKIKELSTDLLIEMILENADVAEVSKSINKLNSNIRRASKGVRIKPQITDEVLNRALLKKILKLASPAELEILATQFLGQRGLKVVKGTRVN